MLAPLLFSNIAKTVCVHFIIVSTVVNSIPQRSSKLTSKVDIKYMPLMSTLEVSLDER